MYKATQAIVTDPLTHEAVYICFYKQLWLFFIPISSCLEDYSGIENFSSYPCAR